MRCQQNLISPHKYLVMTQQNMLYQQIFDKSGKWADSAKKYAVSAKLAYYLIAKPTLGLWLVLYNDVMSLVTIFSNQNYVVLAKNVLSQQKALMMTQDYAVSATMCCYLDRRRTLTWRWPTVYSVWTLTGIWFLSAEAARTSTVVLTSST